MTEVHLRPVTLANHRECLALRVEDAQLGLVASNAKSLAEAYVNPNMTPLAVYDVASRGFEEPPTPMVGFTMLELAAGVGFITRLMYRLGASGEGIWPGDDGRGDPPPAADPRGGNHRDQPPP